MIYNNLTTSCLKRYFHAMTVIERKYHFIEDYYTNDYFIPITLDNLTEINACKSIIKNLLSKYNYIRSVQYELYFFEDSRLANGLPHTHGNSIFFPYHLFFDKSRSNRINVMVHELIHIFQRLYPFHIHRLISRVWKLNIYSTRSEFEKNGNVAKRLLLRSNPDLNNIIYHSQNVYYESYMEESDACSFLNSEYIIDKIDNSSKYDSRYDDFLNLSINNSIQKEHPFETMACVLANHITKKKYMIPYELQEWCDSYL